MKTVKQQDPDKKVFALDIHNLDVEFAMQPKRMKRYGDRMAVAKLERNRAKVNLKLVRAEVEMEVRLNPKRFKLDKITEGVIEACVTLSARTQKAEQDLIQAEYVVDEAESAVLALKQKKDAIEGEIQLYGMQYFAEPRAKGQGKEAMRQLNKTARRGTPEGE